jgi:hypothetical protein
MPPKSKPGKGITYTVDSTGKKIISGPMSIKQAAKIKEQKKIAQAKADAKTAKAAAANPKTVGSNVKTVPAMTAAERGNRNASESARVRNTAFGTKDIMAHAEKNVTKGSTVSIRTGSGISGTSGKSVGKVFKPMGGGGLGGLLGSIKNR